MQNVDFLSNWEEAEKLETKEYQDRLAWTLHMGIMEYLNQGNRISVIGI